jgi:hypothetical protein
MVWKETSPSIIGLMQCIKILPSHNVIRGFLGVFYLDACPWIVAKNFGNVQLFCTFVNLQYLIILQSIYFPIWNLQELDIQHTLRRTPKRCGLITLTVLQRKMLKHMMLPSFDMEPWEPLGWSTTPRDHF